jgi:hypothetical protein
MSGSTYWDKFWVGPSHTADATYPLAELIPRFESWLEKSNSDKSDPNPPSRAVSGTAQPTARPPAEPQGFDHVINQPTDHAHSYSRSDILRLFLTGWWAEGRRNLMNRFLSKHRREELTRESA